MDEAGYLECGSLQNSKKTFHFAFSTEGFARKDAPAFHTI